MPYKPKFCCQCGDKIERTDWKLNSSRRFCELCEIEFKIHDLLPRIALACGVLLAIFGLGTYWRTSAGSFDKSPKQLVGTSRSVNESLTNRIAEPQISTNRNVQISEPTQTNSLTVEAKSPIVPSTNGLKTKQPETAPPAASQEDLYFCGAQTKKGSPCTHKVKGGGRCWQHLGQPAMMAQEKLLVSR